MQRYFENPGFVGAPSVPPENEVAQRICNDTGVISLDPLEHVGMMPDNSIDPGVNQRVRKPSLGGIRDLCFLGAPMKHDYNIRCSSFSCQPDITNDETEIP